MFSSSLFHSHPQVTLGGHTGLWSALMGVYERTEQDGVGPPVYKKQGTDQYLWCSNACGAGQWHVAGNKSFVGGCISPLASCGTAVLPTEHGVRWQYFVKAGDIVGKAGDILKDLIVKDLSICCTEVWGAAASIQGRRCRTDRQKTLPSRRLPPFSFHPPPLHSSLSNSARDRWAWRARQPLT